MVIGVPIIIHRKEKYYGPSRYCMSSFSLIFICNTDFFLLGCWITNADTYIVESLISQYLWMWISQCAMVIFYTITYLVMRGWLVVNDRSILWNKRRGSTRQSEPQDDLTEEETTARAVAHLMLL